MQQRRCVHSAYTETLTRLKQASVVALACALAGAIVVLPTLPPEHVHEAHDAAGDAHSLTHRHAEMHVVAHHEDGATFDDVDPVITLVPVYTAEARVAPVVPLFAPIAFVDVPSSVESIGARDILTRPIHGPPRSPAGLRAPPNSRLL